MDSVNILVSPPLSPQHRLSTNRRPCTDLVEGSRGSVFVDWVSLYEASVTGNWAAAMVILNKHPEYVRFAITEGHDTTLHVATSAKETNVTIEFVKNLVDLMAVEDLELENKRHNTALCLAAAAGNLEMIKIMMKKHRGLMNIAGDEEMMPLHVSVAHGRRKTAEYLYDAYQRLSRRHSWTPDHKLDLLLLKCVDGDLFDLAYTIAKDHRELTKNGSLLEVLARKPDAFNGVKGNICRRFINSVCRIPEKDSYALQLLGIIWKETVITMPKAQVNEMFRRPSYGGIDLSRILFVAAEAGNTRVVIELLQAYPDLISDLNDDEHTIFHIAVMNRCPEIYNLLYEIGTAKDHIISRQDNDGNNMLHLVGKTSVKMRRKTHATSILMQQELMWFKEIEKMMPPACRERKNKDGKTPHELFTEANKDLVAQGLKWAQDCMLVSVLIVTMALGVAFTILGGYDQETGFPTFIHKSSFLVFVTADAISLFFSSTSLLLFLSIHTFHHDGQRDFMVSLLRKLIIGIVTLSYSAVAMIVTFSASFFVIYNNGLNWVPILIATVAAMPVIAFAALYFGLKFTEVFHYLFGSKFQFKRKKRMLYNAKSKVLTSLLLADSDIQKLHC